jgi:hypothetical protein
MVNPKSPRGSRALELTRETEEHGGLPHQIERQICGRDVFFENGAVAAPLREAMAEHEAIVAQTQRVLHERRTKARSAHTGHVVRRHLERVRCDLGRAVLVPFFYIISVGCHQNTRTPRGTL